MLKKKLPMCSFLQQSYAVETNGDTEATQLTSGKTDIGTRIHCYSLSELLVIQFSLWTSGQLPAQWNKT